MAAFGAEVIKIERVVGEETRKSVPVVGRQSIYFTASNCGKKCICLDLRSAEGKAIFADLVQKSDLVLENSPRHPQHVRWRRV